MIHFELLTKDQIASSPSSKDGISPKEENDMRKSCCTFIRNLCKKLDLYPLEYYFMVTLTFIQSYRSHDRFIIAAGCCFLAAKVEESFRKAEEFAQQFILIHQRMDPNTAVVNEIKMKLLLAERIILNVLSFDLIVEQPYITLITLSQSLNLSDEPIQYAWKFANDSVLSTVSIQYTAKTIAAACMYLSISGLKVNTVQDPIPILLDTCETSRSVLDSCCGCLKSLYPNFDTLFHCIVYYKHITLYNRYLV